MYIAIFDTHLEEVIPKWTRKVKVVLAVAFVAVVRKITLNSNVHVNTLMFHLIKMNSIEKTLPTPKIV